LAARGERKGKWEWAGAGMLGWNRKWADGGEASWAVGPRGRGIGPRVKAKAGGLLLSLGWKKKGVGRWREAGQRAEREGVRGLGFFKTSFKTFSNFKHYKPFQTPFKLILNTYFETFQNHTLSTKKNMHFKS
jgi:hypothetical protein